MFDIWLAHEGITKFEWRKCQFWREMLKQNLANFSVPHIVLSSERKFCRHSFFVEFVGIFCDKMPTTLRAKLVIAGK